MTLGGCQGRGAADPGGGPTRAGARSRLERQCQGSRRVSDIFGDEPSKVQRKARVIAWRSRNGIDGRMRRPRRQEHNAESPPREVCVVCDGEDVATAFGVT